eukprot:CAMPEP_0115761918 /NCGR_PEP_ID=MMETSP0272-20121206/100753_1 /TAXON_ID=71861 /ORGANISM="Scrippsiella trochoidea, Strain CCMP3099" /LENGTH=100 /DNA_ID=CAMNT_0003207611 /DNA_START=113 /DNA_END=415 /DNA_ORIENTATION=+
MAFGASGKVLLLALLGSLAAVARVGAEITPDYEEPWASARLLDEANNSNNTNSTGTSSGNSSGNSAVLDGASPSAAPGLIMPAAFLFLGLSVSGVAKHDV